MRYVMLDLIRSLAICGVVGVHIAQTLSSPLGKIFGIRNFYYVSIGGLSVTAFIILSGIVLELKYKNHNITYKDFMKKRIIKLYPIYYMTLILGIVGYVVRRYFGVLPEAYCNLSWTDIFFSLTAFYPYIGKWGGPFVPTSWFIGVILGLYIIYPLIASAIRKNPHIAIFILLTISVISRFIVGKYHILPGSPLDWFPLCRVFEFGFGIYLANVLKENFWTILNNSSRFRSLIVYCSVISFPLFLVHRPVLDIAKYSYHFGVLPIIWVPFFLASSILISWLFLEIDKKIPRKMLIL